MNINPKQIQGMMKRMGISQVPIDAKRVIFECEGYNLVIEDPVVMKINMQGQETYQVNGTAIEESLENFSQEDITLVMEKTGKSEEEVRESLERNEGDIVSSIRDLKE